MLIGSSVSFHSLALLLSLHSSQIMFSRYWEEKIIERKNGQLQQQQQQPQAHILILCAMNKNMVIFRTYIHIHTSKPAKTTWKRAGVVSV